MKFLGYYQYKKFLNNELLMKVGNIMQKLRPDMNIGGNIQKIRYSRKLTQDQVIAKMNLIGDPDLQKYLCEVWKQIG